MNIEKLIAAWERNPSVPLTQYLMENGIPEGAAREARILYNWNTPTGLKSP